MGKRRRAKVPAPAAVTPPPRSGALWLRLFGALLVLLAVFPLANHVTTGSGLPWWPTAVRQWLAFGVAVPAIALVLAALWPSGVDRAIAAAIHAIIRPSRSAFVLGVALLATCISLYTGWITFGLQPVTLDEFSQRWQAVLLAHGHLSALAEPHPEFFSTIETLETNGRWFAQFPLGGAALASIALRLHVPWLLNPLLAGVSVAAFAHFLSRTTDELAARSATLLLAVCPFLHLMSGSQMNHTPTLALLWVAMAALATWAVTEGRTRNGAAALLGFCVGMAATIRPFDAAVVAVAAGVFQLHVVLRRPEMRRSLLVQFVAGAIPVALLLAANHATVGSAFTFAYDALNGPEHRPGFHTTPLGFEHTPQRGVYMASAYLMKLDVGLFAWPVPAFLLVAIAVLLQRRTSRWDAMLVAIATGFIVGYACYWSESYFVGARFLFVLTPIFALYTARFPVALREHTTRPLLRRAAVMLIPIWLIISWVAPPADSRLYGVRELVELYRTRAASPVLASAVRRAGLHNAVVFVPEGLHARLAARLRALGMRPLAAERLAADGDACTLRSALDAAEHITEPSRVRQLAVVQDAVRGDGQTVRIPRLPPSEQISLVPSRRASPDCAAEIRSPSAYGLNIAELLPRMDVDEWGRLGGDIVYARDFGDRNAMLRARFPGRAFFLARPAYGPAGLSIDIVPL